MKKETLLKELVRLTVPLKLQPHEFTADDYITECQKVNPSITDDACRGVLARMRRKGEIKSRKIRLNGKQCNAFSFK